MKKEGILMYFSPSFLIHELIKQETTLETILLKKINERTKINGVRLWTNVKHKKDKKLLYVISSEEYNKMELFDYSVSFIIANEQKKEMVTAYPQVYLEKKELFNLLIGMIERFNLLELKLLQKIADQDSLEDVLDGVSDIMENPVFLIDSAMGITGSSKNIASMKLPKTVRSSIQKEQVDDPIINSLEKNNLVNKLYYSRNPLLIRLDDEAISYISSNFWEENKRIGALCVLEAEQKLFSYQLLILEQISKLLNSYIKNYFNHTILESDLQHLLINLFDGIEVNWNLLDFHLNRLGWSSNNGYYLLKIELSKEAGSKGLEDYFVQKIQNSFPSCFMIKINNRHFVVLLHSQVNDFTLQEIITSLERYLKKWSGLLGVSQYFQNIHGISDQYKFVKATIDLGSKYYPDKSTFFFNDFILLHIINILSNETNLQLFCMDEARTLYDYDQENDSRLLESVYHYLKCNHSLSKASKKLFVHRNTLVYRLRRASELSGIDLNNPDTYFHFLLSYEILHF